MKSRTLFAFIVTCMVSLVGFAQAAAPAKERVELKKGMAADAVIAAVGRPTEVRPMKAPEGTAEVWTYRRLYKRSTEQVATGVVEHPAFVWIGGNLGTTKEVTYSIRDFSVYQVTAVLMFNGQMVSAKQWLEKANGTYQ